MISINDLARMVTDIAGRRLRLINVRGPVGVRGRRSDNHLIHDKLGWAPFQPLRAGMQTTYEWIQSQVKRKQNADDTSLASAAAIK
jgi:nucleoside-diphosphate-sugar epimerase